MTEGKISILRVLCTSCGHTHSILPWDIIPFRVFSASAFLQILNLFHCENLSALNIASLLTVSYQVVYSVLTLFLTFIHRIQLFLRYSFIYCSEIQPTALQCLHTILNYPGGPSAFFLNFLCYHQKPFFMNRRSTSSYPIYISFPKSKK